MNAYLPIERTSHKVHIQIETGNITKEKTHAVVVFRTHDGTATGDSQRVLQAAGEDVEAEYRNIKAQGGRYVSKGVTLTGAGNLRHPRHIFHLNVDQDIHPWKFADTITACLRLADKLELNSITFPPLPDVLQSEALIRRMFKSFEAFPEEYRPISLHFIQVIMSVSDEMKSTQYRSTYHNALCQVRRYKAFAGEDMFENQSRSLSDMKSIRESPAPSYDPMVTMAILAGTLAVAGLVAHHYTNEQRNTRRRKVQQKKESRLEYSRHLDCSNKGSPNQSGLSNRKSIQESPAPSYNPMATMAILAGTLAVAGLVVGLYLYR